MVPASLTRCRMSAWRIGRSLFTVELAAQRLGIEPEQVRRCTGVMRPKDGVVTIYDINDQDITAITEEGIELIQLMLEDPKSYLPDE